MHEEEGPSQCRGCMHKLAFENYALNFFPLTMCRLILHLLNSLQFLYLLAPADKKSFSKDLTYFPQHY